MKNYFNNMLVSLGMPLREKDLVGTSIFAEIIIPFIYDSLLGNTAQPHGI